MTASAPSSRNSVPSTNGGATRAAPAYAGCASTGTSSVLAHQLVERGQADQRRRDEDQLRAFVARDPRLLLEGARRADEARRVEAGPAGLALGPLERAAARGDPRREGTVRLVGKAVVVLHHVDACGGERVGKRREAIDRQSPAASAPHR